MILDRLENWTSYFERESRMGRAFRYLCEHFDAATKEERIEIEGDDIFALPQTCLLGDKDQGRLEAHRCYIDIQLVLEGIEVIGWHSLKGLVEEIPYEANKDITFFRPAIFTSELVLSSGTFAVFFPEDAHAPGLRFPDGPTESHKVVVKIRV